MKTVMFVLLSAATLLLQPHGAASSTIRPQDFFTRIFNLTVECNASLIKNKFVEEVSYLTEGDGACGDKFFCKVEQILNKTHKVCKHDVEDSLRRQLWSYNRYRMIDCAATLHGVRSAEEIQVSVLLEKVKRCIHRRNFMMN